MIPAADLLVIALLNERDQVRKVAALIEHMDTHDYAASIRQVTEACVPPKRWAAFTNAVYDECVLRIKTLARADKAAKPHNRNKRNWPGRK
jgi:hypothetical protein